ncbi:hypothetical protein WJX74_002153 [Apatococcus lobatus]|uniref:26S proteasome non-ATPase regulatory subunit 4 homolog n=2 Tax=Apatococcus TaxID=904362 RepID=A0AAW1T8T9_9CHLO
MEAVVVCVDNSEWTRNGDYAPTRIRAQTDAVNLLAGAKLQTNPENTVGVLTMAGKSPKVLVTPTPSLGKILNAMHDVDVDGQANFDSSVQIAQLALKHRQNKNQRQRIVLFMGSPISETKDKLVKTAKKLKKNNVAVDIVSFGCEEENSEKLEGFQQAVNSGDNSHLVTVPQGGVLSDTLFGSPICQTDGGAGYGAGPGGEGGEAGGSYQFGVDPNLDPELALALRVSLEEEQARQTSGPSGEPVTAAAEALQVPPGETQAEAGSTATPAATPAVTPAAPAAAPSNDGPEPMDEDALLQQALAMSMQEEQPAPSGAGAELAATPAAAPAPASTPAAPGAPAHPPRPAGHGDEAMADAEGEDEALQMALQMSMQEDQPPSQGGGNGQHQGGS